MPFTGESLSGDASITDENYPDEVNIEDSSGINVEENTRTVNTIHHASDGVYVDFGCLLEEGDELVVKKVEPNPIDEDVQIYAYDFKLSSGQPEGAIEIVIPYDDEGLAEEDEHLSVCGSA